MAELASSTGSIPTVSSKRFPGSSRLDGQMLVLLYSIVLLLAFSPFKPLAYLLPFLFLGASVFFGVIGTGSLFRIVVAMLAVTGLGVVHSYLNSEFLWTNSLLGLVTFSSFLILLCDFSNVATVNVLRQIVRITLWVLIVQAAFGIAQGVSAAFTEGGGSFDGSVGDAVKGTINPSLESDGTGSNPMFAILISTLLFTLFLSRSIFLSKWQRYALVPVAVAWLLASVMHTFFFFALAILASVFSGHSVWSALRNGSHRKPASTIRIFVIALGVVVLIFAILALIFPDNISLVGHLLEQTFAPDPADMTPKALATLNTFLYLPDQHPYQPLVGIGLGQYSSRSGLIMSGTYLAREFFLGPQFVEASYELIYQLAERLRDHNPDAGSTTFPFYSWLSVYGEWGLVGFGLLILLAGKILRNVRVAARVLPNAAPLLAPVLVGTWYLLFLGFQDNYWEFAQAIFPPMLLLKLYYDAGIAQWKSATLRKTGLTRPT